MLGNFWWKLFGGIFLAILWGAIGIAFLVTVIGAPLAVPCFKIAWLAFKPFGKDVALVVQRPVLSAIWVVTGGLLMGFVCMFGAVTLALTIVGIPLIKQWWKLSIVSIFPFCTEITL